jgi:hypothetical protein
MTQQSVTELTASLRRLTTRLEDQVEHVAQQAGDDLDFDDCLVDLRFAANQLTAELDVKLGSAIVRVN